MGAVDVKGRSNGLERAGLPKPLPGSLSYTDWIGDLMCIQCAEPLSLHSISAAAAPTGLVCSSERCSRAGESVPLIEGVPILLPASGSIVSAADVLQRHGTAPIHRAPRTSVARHLRSMILGSRSAGNRLVGLFLDNLPSTDADRPSVLVVGGATTGPGVDELYASGVKVAAVDLYVSASITAVADAHWLPFTEGTFQGIWIQSVLEHVLDPSQVVSEIERVLSPMGVVFAESSFLEPVHEGPYDFYRFTPSGHRWLFRRFSEVSAGSSQGIGTQLALSIEYLVRGLTRSRAIGKLVKACVTPILRLIESVVDRQVSLDSSSLVHFLGIKENGHLAAADMVAYYKGSDGTR